MFILFNIFGEEVYMFYSYWRFWVGVKLGIFFNFDNVYLFNVEVRSILVIVICIR